MMTLSKKRVLDPTSVLKTLVDDYGYIIKAI